MQTLTRLRARRVAVAAEPLLADADPPDYADAFALDAQMVVPGLAEDLTRGALEDSPVLRVFIRLVHRGVLGLRTAPEGTAGHIIGWRIVTNEPEVMHIEADGRLGHGAIVCRRTGPGAMNVQTFLWFDHWSSAPLWAAIGPVHRLVAPLLMERVVERRSTA